MKHKDSWRDMTTKDRLVRADKMLRRYEDELKTQTKAAVKSVKAGKLTTEKAEAHMVHKTWRTLEKEFDLDYTRKLHKY